MTLSFQMRVLLALTLLVFVTGALAGGKKKQEMMMWMKMKAMEGCLGESKIMIITDGYFLL